MRKATVTISLLALWSAFGFFMVTRGHEDVPPAPETGTANTSGDESSDAGVADAGAIDAADDPANTGAADAPPSLGRPLRVAAAGWDLLTPGLLANEGPAPTDEGEFGGAGQQVHLRAVGSVDELERLMARGGADERGADIAIVSLPTFAAHFEQLQALQPEVFFVSGWSRGRHAIYAAANDPVTDDAPVFVGENGTPQMFLTAIVAEAVGVDLSDTRLSAADDSRRARGRRLHAVNRSATVADDIRPILTTADATRAIPYVAFAQHGLLSEHGPVIARFIAGWLKGVETLKRDVPGAARTVATMPTSPDAVTLVRRLGQIEFSDLRDNTARFGLTGRDPVTLEQLFTDTWRVWRALGVLTTPRPEMPVDTSPVTQLVLQNPPRDRDDGAAPSFTGEPILSFDIAERSPEIDDLVARLGWLAGAFPSAGIRVSHRRRRPRNAIDATSLISRTVTRYGFSARRFEEATHRSSGITISVIGAE